MSKKYQIILGEIKEDKMKCPYCQGKMVADNGFYRAKLANSTLYVCTMPGCGQMLRKYRLPKLYKQRKPLKDQPLLPLFGKAKNEIEL